MEVTIIGTGRMARALGIRTLAGGHRPTIVGRSSDRAEECARAIEAAAPPGTVATSPIDAPLSGDIVVLAVYFPDACEVVDRFAGQLSGRTVVDISNPVNDSYDRLLVPPESSAAAELARRAPGAHVVKAFNTTFAGLLAEGTVGDQRLDVLVAGDSPEAKTVVIALADDAGLEPIDAGPLARARELEALGFLQLTLQGPLGTQFQSAFKLVGPG